MNRPFQSAGNGRRASKPSPYGQLSTGLTRWVMIPFTLQCSDSVAVAATTVADVTTVFGTGKSVRDARLSHAIPAPGALPGDTMEVPLAAKPRLAAHWPCRFPLTQSGP